MSTPFMSRTRTRKSPAPATPPRIATVECPLCAHANDAEARFCNRCGARVDLVTCAACEAINPRDSGSCYRCGASVSRGKDSEPVVRAAARPVAQPSLPEPTIEPPAAPADRSAVTAPGYEPVHPHAALLDRSRSPEIPSVDELEQASVAGLVTVEESPPEAPASRRRWMRSVVLLVPIVGAVAFLAFPRGDLESITPPPAPVPALPSAAAPPAAAETARGTTAAALPPIGSEESSARQDAPSLPETATAEREATLPESTPAQVTQRSSNAQSANVPSAPSRPRTSERRSTSRAQTSSRPPASIPAPEAATDATSGTLRDQINAGSRRAVSCTVDARALGLCATP
jgi:hypothetical protein